ncbi:SDR family NAD(P)-dependent oxidoreductase [Flavitalea flava]
MNTGKRFENKHVLITGGARGLGFEIACQFAKEGAVLSILDFNKEQLAVAVERLLRLTPIVHSYFADISVRPEVDRVVAEADNLQPIDILINNAGIAFETPFLHIQEQEWKKILDVNLTGMFFVSQSVCRLMAARKKGVVVNMSSKNGMDGEFGYAHYNASKAGVIMLTKTMALELAYLNIRVNAVCPGYIQTPLSEAIDSREFTENFVRTFIPLNRAGKPNEIAPLFLFLASEESSFITGQVFVADGGQLAGQKPGLALTGKI